MERFFAPLSVALLGASASPGKAGYNVLWNLKAARVPRGIYPINPNREEILGFKAYPSLDAIPASGKPVDLAVICLPPKLVRDAINSCIEAGARAIIIESGQLGDTDAEHEQATKEVKQLLASTANAPRIMGPNSIGVIDTVTGVNTSLIPFESIPALQSRGVAVAGQTGLIASGYLQRIIAEGTFPVSKVCCLGNKLDVTELDVLDFLARDPATSTIALYLEDVRDGGRFIALARECLVGGGKPVIIVKSGRTEAGQAAVRSHTGSIAGNDRVFDAALHRCGAIRVDDFEELWIQAQFMHRAPLPAGRRVAVVSISGAGCALSVDAAATSGLSIPPLPGRARAALERIFPPWFAFTNPVDLWAAIEQRGSKPAWAAAAEALLGDAYDALVVVTLAMPESLIDWEHLRRTRGAHPAKPIVLALIGGHATLVAEWEREAAAAGIPVVKSPAAALRALALARNVAEWLDRSRNDV
ncbi:MAG: CoA-binding protein [Candidatus Lokiarchaeota archaeon]|nr:CoA-binding protein [Candidatus Lokiarchaeota archaeon]